MLANLEPNLTFFSALTILHLPHSRFDVVEREAGHLVFETCEIHICFKGCGVLGNCSCGLWWSIVVDSLDCKRGVDVIDWSENGKASARRYTN